MTTKHCAANAAAMMPQEVDVTQWKYGWRFLNSAGGTNPTDKEREHYSVLPRPDQKWSDWTEHSDPAQPDGKDYGAGRLHVMNRPDARYAPQDWWPWYARWELEDEIGRSNEKTSVSRYQLRRVRPVVWWRTIRLGWWRGAILYRADLREANLREANLREANLRRANMSGANLRDANLRDAIMSGANLRDANLRGANLCGADLNDAVLNGADLSGANLRGANLRYADLNGANLSGADLSGAVGYDDKARRS